MTTRCITIPCICTNPTRTKSTTRPLCIVTDIDAPKKDCTCNARMNVAPRANYTQALAQSSLAKSSMILQASFQAAFRPSAHLTSLSTGLLMLQSRKTRNPSFGKDAVIFPVLYQMVSRSRYFITRRAWMGGAGGRINTFLFICFVLKRDKSSDGKLTLTKTVWKDYLLKSLKMKIV